VNLRQWKKYEIENYGCKLKQLLIDYFNKAMQFREAVVTDISQMMTVRLSVKENVLSNPALVPQADYADYLFNRGKGWVCIENNNVLGFSIADLKEHNIWALFVLPGEEGRGIGKRLHDLMLQWYFSQTETTVWLSTVPGSRAEGFYRKAGWMEDGLYGKGEIRFIMSIENYKNKYEI
jgi:GNAT superfamily N-acetyltransferase